MNEVRVQLRRLQGIDNALKAKYPEIWSEVHAMADAFLQDAAGDVDNDALDAEIARQIERCGEGGRTVRELFRVSRIVQRASIEQVNDSLSRLTNQGRVTMVESRSSANRGPSRIAWVAIK